MNESEWISLRHAAEILGVHPATVRNWADKGDLPSRRTPGGHRRFRKTDLMNYAASQGELQPLELQVIIQNALGQARMQVSGGDLGAQPWYAALTEDTRSRMRGMGVRTLEAIRKYLAQGAPDELLQSAVALGSEYAAALTKNDLALPDAVRGYLYFTDFVVNSVLTWSEITPTRNSPAEWVTLLRQVNTFMNTLLLSIIEYYHAE
ncbi:MAG: helix-turn-helix domain-containing protein [Chloroflexi bacterium]|nr:helix-turn-helix domain-containing protein [Chloroflexota bacterium]MDL1884894.1 helix-turn-helix domain-containing protein [Anaerolineae bacterium CFX8]GIL11359.1 MAG: DNA-binding protein [Chloroflexota bacterium]